MILLDHVTVRRGRRDVIVGLDAAIEPGLTVVTGPNGSGKTSLLRVLATSLRPAAGTITYSGLDPTDVDHRSLIRRRLGYVPQEVDTDSAHTIGTLLDEIAFLKGLTQPDDRADALRALAIAHDLTDHLTAAATGVTPGTLRRVLIAQALIGNPNLLIFDEPFGHLDVHHRRRFHRVLDHQRGAGVTIVVSTNDHDDLPRLRPDRHIELGRRP